MHERRIALLAVLLCVAGSACNRVGVESTQDLTLEQFVEKTDAWAVQELTTKRHEHAHRWLSEPGNMLLEGDPRHAQKLIDALYAAGAKGVWFTGIEKIREANVSAAIAVELPSDPALRLALLDREAEFWGTTEPNPDIGQRYLGFSFE